jgi:hypothetical protein
VACVVRSPYRNVIQFPAAVAHSDRKFINLNFLTHNRKKENERSRVKRVKGNFILAIPENDVLGVCFRRDVGVPGTVGGGSVKGEVQQRAYRWDGRNSQCQSGKGLGASRQWQQALLLLARSHCKRRIDRRLQPGLPREWRTASYPEDLQRVPAKREHRRQRLIRRCQVFPDGC